MPTCRTTTCDSPPGWDCPTCNGSFCHECADNEIEDPATSEKAWCPVCGSMMKRRDDALEPAKDRSLRRQWNHVSDDHSEEMWLIQDFIVKQGGRAWQMPQNPTSLRGHKGVPDMEACVPVGEGDDREWVWIKIEVKVGDDQPRSEQENYREWCEKAGMPHVFGGVKDVEQLIDTLWKENDYERPCAAAEAAGEAGTGSSEV